MNIFYAHKPTSQDVYTPMYCKEAQMKIIKN